MPVALWALFIGAFGIGTTEFVIAGILQQLSTDLNVSVPVAGYLATGYALGVFIGAPLVTIVGARFPRKAILTGLTVFFIVGNLVTAFAPNIEIAIAGRLIASLNHGAFFGMGSIIAAELVAPNKRAQAIAFMFTGLTLANLVGVPAGTWIAHALSWRVTFYIISAIGVVTMLAIIALVPRLKTGAAPSVRKEIAAFADIRVLLAMGITVLGPAGFFTSITYITPLMVNVTGVAESSMVIMMVVFGLGLFVGNILGGRYADKALMPTLTISIVAQMVVLFVFWLFADNLVVAVVSIFLMAAFGFATVSPIQKLVMDKAHAAGAPTLASSVNIGMFNLGNALGAWFGGFVIAHGFGFAAPNWAGALLSALALVLVYFSARLERREVTLVPAV